jgi:hypothetical protein
MLHSTDPRAGGQPYFTMENSSRPIKFDVLAKLRRIVDPRAVADNADPTDPYSKAALTNSFIDADAVVVARGSSTRGNNKNGSITAATISATVETSLKGDLRAAQNFEYEDDLLYRPYHTADLVRQVIFLRREMRDGQVVYQRMGSTPSTIKPGLLNSIRSIGRQTR